MYLYERKTRVFLHHLPIMEVRYPRFTKKIYQKWFKHWLIKRFDCKVEKCLDCMAVREVLLFGTRLLLDSLFAEQKRFLCGSNATGVVIGNMSRKHARAVLASYPYVTDSKDISDRCEMVKQECNSDFPELQPHTLASYTENLVSLYQREGNNLYAVLSALYNTANNYRTFEMLPNMCVVEYVILCFHLNKQVSLQASTVSNMWAETLKYDAILLLYDMSTPQFDALQCALQPAQSA